MIFFDQDAYKAQMQLLAERAWDLRRSEREEASLACAQLLQLAEVTADQESLAIGQLVKGLLTLYGGGYETALIDIEKAYGYFSNNGQPIWRVRCLNSLGYAHVVAGTLGNALVYWDEGLELSRKYNFDEMTGFLLYNIGDLQKSSFKRYEDALICFLEAADYCTEGKEAHVMCGPIFASISECYAELGRNEEALETAEEAMRVAIKLNDKISIGLCALMISSLYLKLGNLEQSKVFCLQSLEVREALDDKFAVANTLAGYAELLIKSGEPALALVQAQKALDIVETLKSTTINAVIYNYMGQAYEAMGDYKNSSYWYKEFAKAQAIKYNSELQENLNLVTAGMRLEAIKKDAEISRLKNVELREKNEEIEAIAQDLAETISKLEDTHEQLVRSEKMASLIGLVSGVAHEINTPLGNSITMLSYIKELQQSLKQAFDDQQLVRRMMLDYFENMGESVRLLENSLGRITHIIKSFKKIGYYTRRELIVPQVAKTVLNEWQLKQNQNERGQPEVIIDCSDELMIATHIDALYEILDELYLNSSLHAAEYAYKVSVQIKLISEGDTFILTYSDNGRSTFSQNTQRIFEPFYKGSSSRAGMGLGLHMVYTLVTLVLRGTIVKKDTADQGTCFEMKFKNLEV